MVSTCPSSYVSPSLPPSLPPSSTPSPTFLAFAAAAAAANDGTHVRDPSRTRRTRERCVFPISRSGPGRMLHCAQSPLLHPHPTYSASHHRHPPCPSPSCSPRPVSLHPAATPSAAVRAARHATPPGGDSYYFHFSNSVWGAGNVQHPPLCSLSTHPSLSPFAPLRILYHPRGLSLFSPPPPPSR